MATDFYVVGGAVEDERCYVTREADTKLYNLLFNEGKPGKYCHIFNARQMGKSSLRVQATKKLEKKNIKCCIVRLQGIGTDTNERTWYKSFIRAIFYSFNNLKEQIDFEGWWAKNSDDITMVSCFKYFISDVLLKYIQGKIVIFIDEIDKMLSMPFRDDFFGMIRDCCEERTNNKEYERITFCLVGVATPSDLIQNAKETSYNISEEIELEGFKLDKKDTIKLIEGLNINNKEQAKKVLGEILKWTNGQPFLTQRLCKLVGESVSSGALKEEEIVIDSLVKERVINDWKNNDPNEHFRHIENRITDKNSPYTGILLGIYKKVLSVEKKVDIPNTYFDQLLRLSGLVIKTKEGLTVFNPIYETIFNRDWVENELKNIRPIEYREKKAAWKASAETKKERDKSWLLYGEELENAIQKKYSSLSGEDADFIEQSKENTAECRGEINLKLTREQKNIIIRTAIDWTNRQTEIWEKLIEIVNQHQQKAENKLKDINDFEEWVNKLVREHLLSDQDTKKKIEAKIQTQEEKRFWLLVTYGKILRDKVKDFDLPSGIGTEADDLLKMGLVRKRYEHIQDRDTYWEVANKVYAEVFNQEYIENNLPAFRFNDELDFNYGKKFGLWLINQEEKHLLSNEEISAILPKLDNQELELSYEEHLFLIKSQIKINLN